MMRRSFAIGAVVLALGAPAAVPPGAAAQDAVGFVRDLGNQAIQVLGPSVPHAQRVARFRQLFQDDFDVPGIGRFVLGRYWRVATPQEQEEFLKLFQEYIVQAYSVRLGEYGGQPFRVTGTRPGGDQIVVTSEVIRQNGTPVEIDWYLVNQGGRFRITDVFVAGVSMKVTQRDEFASVIQRNGGRVEALLSVLRQKLRATG